MVPFQSFTVFCSMCLELWWNLKWPRKKGKCVKDVWKMCPCFTGPLTKEIESEITRSPASNTRRPADKNLGPMLPITKEILRDFYTPFNEKLAKVLRNDSFLWENSSKLWTTHLPFTSVKKTTDVSASEFHLFQVPMRINVSYLNYCLSYKSRDESKIENSTTERGDFVGCVCVCEYMRERDVGRSSCCFLSPDVQN